jgi:hypothetical protein
MFAAWMAAVIGSGETYTLSVARNFTWQVLLKRSDLRRA